MTDESPPAPSQRTHAAPFVSPPSRIPLRLVPVFRVVRALLGHVPMPARLLAHSPSLAFAAGVLEALAPQANDMHARDGSRLLAIARIVASRAAGCPFCVDMNVAAAARAGLRATEVDVLAHPLPAGFEALEPREAAVATYVYQASFPGSRPSATTIARLKAYIDEHDVVVLAAALASVHFWSRFNQALGVPDEGFTDTSRRSNAGGARSGP